MNQDMSNKIITYLNASQKVSQRAGRIVPLLLLFLMLIFGDVNVWGQKNKDFSGTYYIANHNRKGTSGYDGYDPSDMTKNFYLRPSTDTYDEEGNQPFLTTKKDRTNDTPSPDIAKWTIKFAKTEDNTDYYYLIHSSKKYLTWHDPMSIDGANATDRVRLHLQSALNEENALFYFTEGNKGDNDYNICLKGVNCSKNTIGSLNPAKNNIDNEEGVTISGAGTVTVGSKTIQCGGLIGIYEQNDATGVWYLEEVSCKSPVITYDYTTKEVSITCATEGSTIYYTINGDNPTTESSTYDNNNKPTVTERTIIKAIATKENEDDSEVQSVTIVTDPVIIIGESVTYNGSPQKPIVSVKDGEIEISPDEYEISYYNNKDVGDATITVTNKEGGNYIVYGSTTFTINKQSLTITATAKSKIYGDEDPELTYTQNGLVGTDVLTGVLTREEGEDVGSYAIINTLEAGNNYDVTYVPANLTVTPKTIGVEWTDTELSYNGNEQAPTATATGLVNNDEVGVTVTGAQTNVGTDYIATASALTGEKKDNYQLPEGLTHTFTITPKSIGDGNKAADDIIIELSPEGELSVVKQGEKILVEDTDYTQETEVDGDDKIITITGMGNYAGSIKALFANPVFTDPDGTGSEKAAAVYTASRDLSAPAGIEPYIVRKVNPSIGTLVISKLDYIPEDVPVLLLSNAESEGFVASPKDPSIPEVTVQTKNSNQLKVSHGGETVEAAQIYMFYKGEFVLTKAGTLGEGKYFLYNPNFKVTPSEDEDEEEAGENPASSRGVLRIVFEDETTGIDDLKNEKTEEWKLTGWYSLDGRRLSGKPTKGGIYIHKGQKLYIKRK